MKLRTLALACMFCIPGEWDWDHDWDYQEEKRAMKLKEKLAMIYVVPMRFYLEPEDEWMRSKYVPNTDLTVIENAFLAGFQRHKLMTVKTLMEHDTSGWAMDYQEVYREMAGEIVELGEEEVK